MQPRKFWPRTGDRWSPTPDVALIFTNPPGEGGAVARATAPFTSQRSRSWLGLVPFLAFLVLFLIVPAISVFSQALRGANGEFGFASMGEAFSDSYFNIPLMVLVILPAIDGLKPAWREACSSLGGNSSTYWRRVGLPVLAPSILGGFILLFANSFSAYATAAQLTDNSKIVPLRIGFFLGGDVSVGEDAVGYALAAWMIVIMAVAMILYWALRRRAERWQS
ncbi:MAG: ABC transporter permease subunit [Acidimicrobiia bacterium]|nr:ABC transporter permease subunit [Acidimicrobiia bacterium]